MWTYSQSTGILISADRTVTGHGYAGKGLYKNNPTAQCIKGEGPLPRGFYTIGPAYKHETKGPVCMNLTPDASNDMCDRSLFRIHGDSIADPGNASEGCIVQNKAIRQFVAGSSDRRLEVVI
jgi:hypothetical protein